jgi:hemolysin III
MTPIHDLVRRYDVSEIIADGVVHGIGVVAALIAVTALIFYATVWGLVDLRHWSCDLPRGLVRL